jgi:hypothetical protein
MNSEELKAATERLQRWDAGELPSKIYPAASDPIESANNDAWDVARAYMKRMNADAAERIEREKSIDEEWLRPRGVVVRDDAGGFGVEFCDGATAVIERNHQSRNASPSTIVHVRRGGNRFSVTASTRGQLLDLLRWLGAEGGR